MGKHSRYNKYERKIIIWAQIYRYSYFGGILLPILLSLLIEKIIKTENVINGFIPLFAFASNPVLWGCYTVIGAALEWKHVQVSLQLSHNYRRYRKESIKPRRGWTKNEKRDMIGVGILFIILGIALIVMIILGILGIL